MVREMVRPGWQWRAFAFHELSEWVSTAFKIQDLDSGEFLHGMVQNGSESSMLTWLSHVTACSKESISTFIK